MKMKMFENENVGLYRDDGLGVFWKLSGPEIERTRIAIVRVFREWGLSITTKGKLKVVYFLDAELNSVNAIYQSYRKPNDNPTYININSNHPPSIKKQIPKSVSQKKFQIVIQTKKSLTTARTWSDALKKCEKPAFVSETSSDPYVNEKSRRKIIWFNPPCSINIKNNICKTFSSLLHKHFPLRIHSTKYLIETQ